MSDTRARAILAGAAARRGSGSPAGRAAGGFVPVREPDTGKLLFRYHPVLLLVEIVRRQRRTVVDLRTGRVMNGRRRDEG